MKLHGMQYALAVFGPEAGLSQSAVSAGETPCCPLLLRLATGHGPGGDSSGHARVVGSHACSGLYILPSTMYRALQHAGQSSYSSLMSLIATGSWQRRPREYADDSPCLYVMTTLSGFLERILQHVSSSNVNVSESTNLPPNNHHTRSL